MAYQTSCGTVDKRIFTAKEKKSSFFRGPRKEKGKGSERRQFRRTGRSVLPIKSLRDYYWSVKRPNPLQIRFISASINLMAALRALFGFNRKQLAFILIVSTCAAVGVAFALHSALWSVPSWSLQQSYSPKYTEADFPSWFTQGREELFGSFV